MATAVTVRADFSTDELRRLAAASKHANQSRRLLSLAAVLDGMSRACDDYVGREGDQLNCIGPHAFRVVLRPAI